MCCSDAVQLHTGNCRTTLELRTDVLKFSWIHLISERHQLHPGVFLHGFHESGERAAITAKRSSTCNFSHFNGADLRFAAVLKFLQLGVFDGRPCIAASKFLCIFVSQHVPYSCIQASERFCISWFDGATGNAKPDIARLDNAKPYSNTSVFEWPACHFLISFLRHLCVLLYTV